MITPKQDKDFKAFDRKGWIVAAFLAAYGLWFYFNYDDKRALAWWCWGLAAVFLLISLVSNICWALKKRKR